MFMKQALMTMLQNRRHTIEHSWQVSLGFLVICADFAQFLRSFSTMRNFAQILSITKIFARKINFRQSQNFSVW